MNCMNIEYEAKFLDIERGEMRRILEAAGAKLIRPEFLQKRVVFAFPDGHEIAGGWARVRDEGDKITMSLKIVDGEKIENQKEICLTVDSFEQAELLLVTIGCRNKSYQETKRELWILDDAEITIDEWPFLRPFLEIEGKSEEMVERVTKKIGLDYARAVFGAVDIVCIHQYPHLTFDRINKIPHIVFEGDNPFL